MNLLFDREPCLSYFTKWSKGRRGCLKINPHTHRNSVDLLYISSSSHSRGIGQAAWKAIEAQYPETKVWEVVTPYFEKRNIHFM